MLITCIYFLIVSQPTSPCASQSRVTPHQKEGYISSHVTSQTGCGSPTSPWVIEAQSGQTVDLWLLDFGSLGRRDQSLHTSCHEQYGFIIERDLGVNLTICGGIERKNHLYMSKTNKVEIHVLLQRMGPSNFFVQYTCTFVQHCIR